MFSMEQMVMTLSAESRMTSNSISFQSSDAPLDEHLVDPGQVQAAVRDLPQEISS